MPAHTRSLYRLGPCEAYRFLNHSAWHASEDAAVQYNALVDALTLLRFAAVGRQDIFRVLAVVLHLGNVVFRVKGAKLVVDDVDLLRVVARLLCVSEEELQQCLIHKQRSFGGEVIWSPLTKEEADDARDALAKVLARVVHVVWLLLLTLSHRLMFSRTVAQALYGQLFSHIIDRINDVMACRDPMRVYGFVGILDIFGFEIFKINRFEQFFINFANECLQQHFNEQVFVMEQKAYKAEGIRWTSIAYTDNDACIELVSARPRGILCVLDEESGLQHATDATLLAKMHKVCHDHKSYALPKVNDNTFGVRHFAGDVFYDGTSRLPSCPAQCKPVSPCPVARAVDALPRTAAPYPHGAVFLSRSHAAPPSAQCEMPTRHLDG